MISITDMPVEIQDLIFQHLTLAEYLDLLVAIPGLSMSEYQEDIMLVKAAKGLSELESLNYDTFLNGRRLFENINRLLSQRCRVGDDLKLEEKSERLVEKVTSYGRAGNTTGEHISMRIFARDPAFWDIWKTTSVQFRGNYIVLALQSAAQMGRLKVFASLCSSLESLKGHELDSLLQYACQSGIATVVESIIRIFTRQFSADYARNYLDLALYHAVRYDQLHILRHLLHSFKGSYRELFKLLTIALKCGRPVCLNYIVLRLQRSQRFVSGLKKFLWFQSQVKQCAISLHLGLIGAAEGGNLASIRMILWNTKRNSPRISYLGVNLSDMDHGSALQEAATRGYLSIVEFFLAVPNVRHFFDEEQLIDNTKRALLTASSAGHLPIVQHLLRQEHGVPVFPFIKDFDGPEFIFSNPLVAAARNGHVQVVQFLLSDAHHLSSEFSTDSTIEDAYMMAARHGRLKVFKFFLQMRNEETPMFAAANCFSSNQAALSEAIKYGRRRTVAFLMRRKRGQFVFPGIQHACETENLVELAVTSRASKILSFLLRRDKCNAYIIPHVNPKSNLLTLRNCALRANDVQTLMVLLERDGNSQYIHAAPNQVIIDLKVLLNVIKYGQCIILRYLLQRDSNGQFLFRELRMGFDYDLLIRAVLQTGNTRMIAELGNSFPNLRATILWRAIETQKYATINSAIDAFKDLIDMTMDRADDDSVLLHHIPHPIATAIITNDTRVLRMLLHQSPAGTLLFSQLFGRDTMDLLMRLATKLEHFECVELLRVQVLESELEVEMDDRMVNPRTDHFHRDLIQVRRL